MLLEKPNRKITATIKANKIWTDWPTMSKDLFLKLTVDAEAITFPATGDSRLTSEWIEGSKVSQVLDNKVSVSYETVPEIQEGFAVRFHISPVSEDKVKT